jgi:hypothetical protein
MAVNSGKSVGQMKNEVSLKENGRSWQRFNILLRARYFLQDFSWYRECVIIDISRQGASVNLPIDEKVALGNSIILEVVTKQLDNITFKGDIVWIKQSENAFLVGVKFKKLLDFQMLGKLY